MARSNFPAEADTKPGTARSRASERPTVPAPSGRYRVAAEAEPVLQEAPPLPSFPAEEGSPLRMVDASDRILVSQIVKADAANPASLAATVRPTRRAQKVAREEYAPRKRDPRAEED